MPFATLWRYFLTRMPLFYTKQLILDLQSGYRAYIHSASPHEHD